MRWGKNKNKNESWQCACLFLRGDCCCFCILVNEGAGYRTRDPLVQGEWFIYYTTAAPLPVCCCSHRVFGFWVWSWYCCVALYANHLAKEENPDYLLYLCTLYVCLLNLSMFKSLFLLAPRVGLWSVSLVWSCQILFSCLRLRERSYAIHLLL